MGEIVLKPVTKELHLQGWPPRSVNAGGVTGKLRGPGGGPPLGLFDKRRVITVLAPVVLGAFQVLSLNNSS